MSTGPDGAPVPREAPAPPGSELPEAVDEIEQRVDEEVRRVAARSREEDSTSAPSGDVVPDGAEADGDGGDAPLSEPTD
ncbi:hypothetical protein MO973_09760 [Paenibacillus sp. TRM 82003]|uniref:hypothetical protein n=1 Tax=Kineococcus sp. TRM81007 TaxID=2925831 RepID=UPI001F57E50A|nr:hypothetical protein [Kineococcus sp. TRM81007]MCI2238133.1 hypothetical protein [Kineococcus sp. TRM81007]MCI3920517.1 hypothetical protein [Paenibacillus sp. TRM 82003]